MKNKGWAHKDFAFKQLGHQFGGAYGGQLPSASRSPASKLIAELQKFMEAGQTSVKDVYTFCQVVMF